MSTNVKRALGVAILIFTVGLSSCQGMLRAMAAGTQNAGLGDTAQSLSLAGWFTRA